MVNFYELIKVSPTASTDEIKKAINNELRRWSNRTNAAKIEQRQEAERMVKFLEQAESTLLDSSKRAEYDRQLKATPKDERRIDDSELTGKDDVGLIKEAWRLLIAGNVADAMYVATKATQSQGNNPEAWAVLAQAKFKWGETEDAIYEYKRAIQLKPNEASYYFDLGGVYESAERLQDALQQYQRASTIDPRTTMYRAAIGILFARNDKYKEGIEILEACVGEEPDNPVYQWFLAIAYSGRAYENWTFVPEGGSVKSGYYATEKSHVEEAIELIGKAEKLRFDDNDLLADIKSQKENIHAMYERKFYGNWLVTGIWFLIGLIILAQKGGFLMGLVFIGIASFYIYASRPPQFLLNRKVIKGESPTGGFDGILWVICFYPFMAVWNFYKNHIEVGSLNTAYSFGESSATTQTVPEITEDEMVEPIGTSPTSPILPDVTDGGSRTNTRSVPLNTEDEMVEPIKDTPTYPIAPEVNESQKQNSKDAASSARYESTKGARPTQSERPNFIQKSNTSTLIASVLAVVLLVIGVYFAYDYFFVKQSFVGKIERALASGKYFEPPGENVQDIYRAQRMKSPDSKNLKEASDMIISRFGKEGDEALQRFYNDSDDTGWGNITKMYEFLAEIAPNDNEIQAKMEFAKAHGIMRTGRGIEYNQALSHYQKALQLKPNWVFAINGIAKIYVRKNSPYYNRVEALNWYTRACEADPNFPWAYTNMAAIYSEDRQWDIAEQTLLKALALKKNRPSILIELGNLCEKQSKKSEAKTYYLEALKYETNPEKTNWLHNKINSII